MKRLLILIPFFVSCNIQEPVETTIQEPVETTIQEPVETDRFSQIIDSANLTKVYFANSLGYGDAGEPHYVECFVAGYQSTGATWNGIIKLDSFVNYSEIHSYILPFMQDSGYNLMLRPTQVGGYNYLSIDSFYRQGLQVITCSGSNVYHLLTSLLPLDNIIVCGAGDSANVTSYFCEFYSSHPFVNNNNYYQSYSHAYIAGKIAYIKDRLKCSWWEARYRARVTASENNNYHTFNGYGEINTYEAINYSGIIPGDPYD